MTERRRRVARFLSELKRRHVYRVTIAYLIAAFAIAEAADVIMPRIGVSEAAVTLVVILLLLGLPLAVVLAWAFDITPQGVQRTTAVETAAAGDETAAATAAAPALPAGSIAALPFANLSENPANDYFSDGLTEELIGMLSRVPDLRVAARSSCFALKNAGLDAVAAGRRLGVRHIVEGGVRMAGQRVRLTVQVVDAQTGFAVWSEQFDREMTDIFEIQREIANAIVARVSSGGTRERRRERRTTEQIEALKLYMQGRYCCNRRTEGDLQRAIEFFDRAVAVDPEYALAHAGLAETYAIQLDYGFMPPAEALEQARVAAERALQLDPSAAETHTSLALVRQFEWRWDEAERAFETAIRLDPDHAVAHQRLALHLAWIGRYNAALDHARTAERLEPLTPATSATVGWVLYYARRYDEAAAHLEDVLAREPQFATARIALGRSLLMAGRTAEAVEQHEEAVRVSGRSASTLALLAHALGTADRPDEAREIANELERRAASYYVSGYYRALPHLGVGRLGIALDYLEAARAERAAQLVYVRSEPIMDPLRNDARFQTLLRALAFPKP